MASTIDEAILSVAQPQWLKVAMVILRALDTLGLEWSDENCELVAQRIEALVNDKRLGSQGNLKNWRRSEVRLPTSNT